MEDVCEEGGSGPAAAAEAAAAAAPCRTNCFTKQSTIPSHSLHSFKVRLFRIARVFAGERRGVERDPPGGGEIERRNGSAAAMDTSYTFEATHNSSPPGAHTQGAHPQGDRGTGTDRANISRAASIN